MVIGYGNVLRGDDGVGPATIELLRSRRPEVDAIAVPMLVPELAPVIAAAQIVVFIDARVDGLPGDIRVEPVVPSAGAGASGHLLSAETLMALARDLYGSSARGIQVSVGGTSFEVGAAMSEGVAAALPAAADIVIDVLQVGAVGP